MNKTIFFHYKLPTAGLSTQADYDDVKASCYVNLVLLELTF